MNLIPIERLDPAELPNPESELTSRDIHPIEAFHQLDSIYSQLERLHQHTNCVGMGDESYFLEQLSAAMDLVEECAEEIKSYNDNSDDDEGGFSSISLLAAFPHKFDEELTDD